MSILRLDYILKVLRVIYKNKAAISDPDAFKDKIKNLLRQQKRMKKMKYQRADSKSSFASMYSKSQRTGLSEGSKSGKSSNGGDSQDEHDEIEQAEDASMATAAIAKDPVMLAFETLFDFVKEGIETQAEQKLYAVEI